MGKHLVTGGCGYVGDYIVKKLSTAGEQVCSLDVLETEEKREGVEYIKGSVLDEELIDYLTTQCDYVHHNAALVPLTKSGIEFNKVNVEGTKIVFKYALRNKISHLCHMSSSAVFGIPDELPLTNSSLRKPVEIYGQSKKDAEDIVMTFIASNPSLSCSIVRPRTILGTNRLGIFELLFRWISQGKNIFVIGKADSPFQFAHIEDIANASINSCLLKKKGVYNVGTLNFNSLTNDLTELIKFSDTSSKVIHLPESITINGLALLDKLNLSPFAPWHYLTYHKPFFFDSKYVFEELDYQPRGSNIEILKESYSSYLKNYKDKKNLNLSPHKSKLKSSLIDLIANIISLR